MYTVLGENIICGTVGRIVCAVLKHKSIVLNSIYELFDFLSQTFNIAVYPIFFW